MIPFPQFDISQYEFEEFCDKWMFYFYEKSNGGEFDSEKYSQMWHDANKIGFNINFKYEYITSLKTWIKFKPSSDTPLGVFWDFKIKQLK